MMMLQCWEFVPDKRPSFKTLYKHTSNFVEGLAGYLEMGFNPFAVVTASEPGKGTTIAKNEDKNIDEEVEVG